MEKQFLLKYRKLIGATLVLFYPVCVLLYFLFGLKLDNFNIFDVFSNIYFTNARNVYIASCAILAAFFALYSGYERIDRILCRITAIALGGMLIFPVIKGVSQYEFTPMFDIVPNMPLDISDIGHAVFANILLASQSLYIGFVFTKSSGTKTKEKKIRNIIYIVCASICGLLSITTIIDIPFHKLDHAIYYIELIVFIIFGICWLIKGEVFKFLNDK